MNTLFALLAKYGDTNIPLETGGWVTGPLLHRLCPDQALLGVLLQIFQRGRILNYCVS